MFHCPKDEWTKGSRAFFNCKIRSKETNLIDQYWKGSVRSIYDVLLAYCMYQWHIVPLAYFGGLPVVHCTSGISCGACDLQRRYQINCVMPELNQEVIESTENLCFPFCSTRTCGACTSSTLWWWLSSNEYFGGDHSSWCPLTSVQAPPSTIIALHYHHDKKQSLPQKYILPNRTLVGICDIHLSRLHHPSHYITTMTRNIPCRHFITLPLPLHYHHDKKQPLS